MLSIITMKEDDIYDAANFCLVSDNEIVNSVVKLGCPEPCHIQIFDFEGLVNERLELSQKGHQVVAAAQKADGILVSWHLDKAPIINTLGYHIREALAGPLIALCGANQYDKVAALAAGADDAIMLPVYLPLIQAIVISYRRLTKASQVTDIVAPGAVELSSKASSNKVLEVNNLRLDDRSRRFFIDGKEVILTHREYALLHYLMSHVDEALPRDQILKDVWGLDFETGTNMVDVYMYFLRRKLEVHGLKGIIETIRGFGYRLSTTKN